MARNQQTVYNSLVANYIASCTTAGVNPLPDPTKWSQYNIQALFFWTVAGGIVLFEQILDVFTSDVEAQVAQTAPQTYTWWQAMMFLFQFNTATPQLLEFNTTTLAPGYASVIPADQVITNCTIVPGAFGTLHIKVAANNNGVPGDLNTYAGAGALAAAQTYANLLSVPGITVNVTSGNPDNIYIGGTVTYNGQYAALIPVSNGTVVQAIQAFLAAIPATGVAGGLSQVGLLKLTDLIAAVRAVPGVIDFELNNVNARLDGTAFVPGSYNLVSANTWASNEYNSGLIGVGFMITENTASYTINNSLVYVAE